MYGRTNKASALTRRARTALRGRVALVVVKSDGYLGAGAVSAAESDMESLMSAREILAESGLVCSAIVPYFGERGFYISFPESATA